MPHIQTRPSAKDRLLALLAAAVRDGTFTKLTLGTHRGADATLRNVFVRPVELRAGPRLSFVFRHATRDVTQNFTHGEARARIEELLGGDFRSAHLFTTGCSAQLDWRDGKEPRLVLGKPRQTATPVGDHDRAREQLIAPAGSPWLQDLGITTPDGRVAKGMEAKLRQVNKFVEILSHLVAGMDFGRRDESPSAISLVDMGSGKGYVTFAAYDWLRRHGWPDATARGIEARPELVELCNRAARANNLSSLTFDTGSIASASLDRVDVLIALHACDTATDDALAQGIAAGASLIIVSPCCHQELRPQLQPPPVLAGALRHGILRERHAEFVTDALRAGLLEWAGYETKVFEFISTEHTAKNLMIAATKRRAPADRDKAAANVRELAAFYGVCSQRLAASLNFPLTGPAVAQ